MDNASFFVVIVGFFAGVAISSSLSSRFARSELSSFLCSAPRHTPFFEGHTKLSARNHKWPLDALESLCSNASGNVAL